MGDRERAREEQDETRFSTSPETRMEREGILLNLFCVHCCVCEGS